MTDRVNADMNAAGQVGCNSLESIAAAELAALRDENIILRMEVERLNATLDKIAKLLERYSVEGI